MANTGYRSETGDSYLVRYNGLRVADIIDITYNVSRPYPDRQYNNYYSSVVLKQEISGKAKYINATRSISVNGEPNTIQIVVPDTKNDTMLITNIERILIVSTSVEYSSYKSEGLAGEFSFVADSITRNSVSYEYYTPPNWEPRTDEYSRDFWVPGLTINSPDKKTAPEAKKPDRTASLLQYKQKRRIVLDQ